MIRTISSTSSIKIVIWSIAADRMIAVDRSVAADRRIGSSASHCNTNSTCNSRIVNVIITASEIAN